MSLEQERNRPGRQLVTLMELYQPKCRLRYGETNEHGTCPAVLGEDSPAKCFNTLRSCPVPDSFDPEPEDDILRFSTAQQDIPPDWRIRPTIVDVDSAPRRLSPSKGLGEGAKAEVTVLDHPWHDIGTDPYVLEKGIDDSVTEVRSLGSDVSEPGVFSGSTDWGKAPTRKAAPRFDGNSQIEVPPSGTQEECTWEAWVFRDFETSGQRMIVSGGSGSSTYVGCYGDGSIRVNTPSGPFNTAEGIVPLREWTFVTVRISSSATDIFINGEVADSRTPRTGVNPPIFVGSHGGTFQWIGRISEVRIWNYARPDLQIKLRYRDLLTGNEPGLVAYWPLDDAWYQARDYDPIEQGTYWGKWLARNPYYRGWRMRLLYGYISPEGFSLDDFEVREYVIDKIEGPDTKDRVKITGTDVFALLEKERAVVPKPSRGELADGIDEEATEFELAPAGIGDEEYPAEFVCCIGNEGFEVTRAGDMCTIQQRGLYRGVSDHEPEDLVQIVRRFEPSQVNQIAEAIITEGQPELAPWIPSQEWQAEADEFLTRLYAGDIPEPTAVNELLAELMESVPVHFWPDERERRIRMRAIKAPPGNAPTLTDAEHYLADSLEKKERPKDRVDSVLVNFGMLDPTEDRGDTSNYSQGVYRVNDDAQKRYGTQQLKTINSRWISRYNKAAAEDLARLYIRRYRETPITISYALDAKRSDLWTGDIFRALTRKLQGLTGAMAVRNFQIIEAHPEEPGHRYEYEAESYDWWISDDDDGDDENYVPISQDDFNINLREIHDSIYSSVSESVLIRFEQGVKVGSNTTTGRSIEVGDWPDGTTVILEFEEGFEGSGKGGRGGKSDSPIPAGAVASDYAGEDGGTALYTRFPITVRKQAGRLAGGGAGGGGFAFGNVTTAPPVSGGGGAGRVPGQAGPVNASGVVLRPGDPGTTETGGDGGSNNGVIVGGDGGDLGQDGTNCTGPSDPGGPHYYGVGGTAGPAVDGESYITWEEEGEILGNRIN